MTTPSRSVSILHRWLAGSHPERCLRRIAGRIAEAVATALSSFPEVGEIQEEGCDILEWTTRHGSGARLVQIGGVQIAWIAIKQSHRGPHWLIDIHMLSFSFLVAFGCSASPPVCVSVSEAGMERSPDTTFWFF